MPTLAIRFTAGRYHATPWYRHVNEGAVEWPPAPWRLLRALLAVGFAKQHWPGAVDEIPPVARQLIEKLASVRPQFALPQGAVAHTRHYMPIVDGANQETTKKVLDTFLRLSDPDTPLLVHWEVALSEEETTLLRELAAGLAYLGRAESWVSAALIGEVPPDQEWSRPHVAGEAVPPGWAQVASLAPLAAEQYAAWRTSELAATLAATGTMKAKKRAELEASYPVDLLACLCTDTATLQKAGWSQPPGSQRILYLRRADALEPAVARPRTAHFSRPSVEAALLTLASDNKGGQLCPLLIRALPQMERLHDTAVACSNGQCAALRGCDAEQKPLRGHRHAHWLPLDLDGDGRIDHVLVHAPMGLDPAAQQTLSRIHRTYGKDLPAIVVSLAGFGSLATLRRQLRTQRGSHPAELATAMVWESRTPFLAPRHLKAAGKNSLAGQVQAECESRGYPVPVLVEELSRDERVERRFLEFIRSRPDKAPPQTRPLGLRLTFAAPITGPLCLGYASHFGLGMFAGVGEGGGGCT
jgi:CRISPR-associated protein Csb2